MAPVPWYVQPQVNGAKLSKLLRSISHVIPTSVCLTFQTWGNNPIPPIESRYDVPRINHHWSFLCLSFSLATLIRQSAFLISDSLSTSTPWLLWSVSTPVAAGPKGLCGSGTADTCCGATSPTTAYCDGPKRAMRLAFFGSQLACPTAIPVIGRVA